MDTQFVKSVFVQNGQKIDTNKTQFEQNTNRTITRSETSNKIEPNQTIYRKGK